MFPSAAAVAARVAAAASTVTGASRAALAVRTFTSTRAALDAPTSSSTPAPAASSSSSSASSSSSSSQQPSPRDRLRRFARTPVSGPSSSSPAQGSSPSGSAFSRPPRRAPSAGGASFQPGSRSRARSAGPAGSGAGQGAGQAGGRGAPGPSGPRDSRRRGSGGRSGRGRRGPTSILPFEQWIKGPIAARYKETPSSKGPHWIGDTPFPLNPSFRPPPPIHARVKDELWRLHSSDPAQHTVRSLSAQFSIGLPRVEAILRLKALERDLSAQGFPLQTEFQSNMDRLLGSEQRPNINPEQDPVPHRKDHSPRGQIWEEMPEAAATAVDGSEGAGSVLAPALAAIAAERADAVRAMPNRGVDPEAISPARTLRSTTADKVTPTAILNPSPSSKRPPLQITTHNSTSTTGKTPRAVLAVVNVSGRSYEGDGRIARNQKRAEKRQKIKAKQRAAREAAAAVAAAAPTASPRQKQKQGQRPQSKRRASAPISGQAQSPAASPSAPTA
ncbi:hypothetical protein OC842_005571 [Tilletia horrida]|uniref:Uncharacterized protein n=1 Tax=Tilletia horrida TaxID=155126 RepID=A0AAN6JIV8_9BASI|nr:hypothetical protein OC842_005571 [Tilletia horrida]